MAVPALSPIRILGIDPGLLRCGWGIVESAGPRLSYVACGVVKPPPELPLSARLFRIVAGLGEVIAAHGPQEAAIEETFVNMDPRATLKLGAARGAAMIAPAQAGLAVAEYAPNLVKKSVTGVGHADKGQIRAMIAVLLPRTRAEAALTDDMADALAIAICHAHHRARSP